MKYLKVLMKIFVSQPMIGGKLMVQLGFQFQSPFKIGIVDAYRLLCEIGLPGNEKITKLLYILIVVQIIFTQRIEVRK